MYNPFEVLWCTWGCRSWMWTGIWDDVTQMISDVISDSGSHPTTAPSGASQNLKRVISCKIIQSPSQPLSYCWISYFLKTLDWILLIVVCFISDCKSARIQTLLMLSPIQYHQTYRFRSSMKDSLEQFC